MDISQSYQAAPPTITRFKLWSIDIWNSVRFLFTNHGHTPSQEVLHALNRFDTYCYMNMLLDHDNMIPHLQKLRLPPNFPATVLLGTILCDNVQCIRGVYLGCKQRPDLHTKLQPFLERHHSLFEGGWLAALPRNRTQASVSELLMLIGVICCPLDEPYNLHLRLPNLYLSYGEQSGHLRILPPSSGGLQSSSSGIDIQYISCERGLDLNKMFPQSYPSTAWVLHSEEVRERLFSILLQPSSTLDDWLTKIPMLNLDSMVRKSPQFSNTQGSLPWAWEEQTTSEGQQFFTDTRTGMTMWADPQIGRGLSSRQSQLPLGWEERFVDGYQYFYDTITNTDAWDDPRLGNELGSVLPAWQEETHSDGNWIFHDFTTRCGLFIHPPKNPKPLSPAAQAGSIPTTTEATTSEDVHKHKHASGREFVPSRSHNERIETLGLSEVEEHTSQSPGSSHVSRKRQKLGIQGDQEVDDQVKATAKNSTKERQRGGDGGASKELKVMLSAEPDQKQGSSGRPGCAAAVKSTKHTAAMVGHKGKKKPN
ncbi:E3 ubiquitin-protein ligase nedd4 [Marasmius crinis-equi]|uniref:E3 ubiquitin-protein ligase nedd4 n=1 Tax=Marasmius crinis-equi TaxID=585013 RepID=A0ABR3F881_9AGAR